MNQTGSRNIELLAIIAGLIFSYSLFFYAGSNPHLQLKEIPFTNKEQLNSHILSSGFYEDDQLIIKKAHEKYAVIINENYPGRLKLISPQSVISDAASQSDLDLMFISTSPIWRPPLMVFQNGVSVRVFDKENRKAYHRTYFNFKKEGILPVMAITVDDQELFDPVTGILVQGIRPEKIKLRDKWWDYPGNYQQRGSESEVPCYFEFFDAAGKLNFSAFAGFRIQGNATRAFPQKSIRLSAGKKYGNKSFEYPFFGNDVKHPSLVLRNGGNDWGRTFFSDALMQFLVSDLDLCTQKSQPVIAYLNGEYWGLYYLRERIDETYLAQKFKVPKKKILLVETDELKNGNEEEFGYFKDLLSKAEKADPASGFQMLELEMDMDNFMHYLITEIYFANLDWPFNNTKLYKLPEKKWKWIVYDLDYGYGYTGMPGAANTDLFAVLKKNRNMIGRIYNICMKNSAFRKQFAQRFKSVMKNQLNEKRQMIYIDKFASEIENEIPLQTLRWRKPASKNEWQQHVNVLRDFASARKQVIELQLKKYFQ